jgi:hypothetical protein
MNGNGRDPVVFLDTRLVGRVRERLRFFFYNPSSVVFKGLLHNEQLT